MTTTQELVERLREGLPYVVSATVWAESEALKAEAASRLSEMDAEVKRLREALENIAQTCTDEINARWPPTMRGSVNTTKGSKIYPLLDMPRRLARAALEHQQKGEPKP